MENIRAYLGNLISENEESWWKQELFEKNVLASIPSEIEVLELPPADDKNYNCFVYALGLNDNEDILKDSKGFIYSAFLEKLISRGETEITPRPSANDLILYRNPQKLGTTITHAGVLQADGRVISKWSWGPLMKHNVFTVPDFYGDETRYLKAIPKNKARELYWRYRAFNKK